MTTKLRGINAVAKKYGYAWRTIKAWTENGVFKKAKQNPSGIWVYDIEELEKKL